MQVALVNSGKLRAFRGGVGLENAQLAVFGFEGIKEVSYEKELKGESNYFEDVALLSKQMQNVIVCGCITDTHGHKRKSAVVAEKGRLLGVSDMLNVIDGGVGAGAALRVYDTKIGKMGVVVAEDLYFPETVKALCVCGSDFIVCPFGDMQDGMQNVLLRAYAYCYGVPIIFCAQGYGTVVSANGKLVFSSPLSPVKYSLDCTKEYHLIETRKRGGFRGEL